MLSSRKRILRRLLLSLIVVIAIVSSCSVYSPDRSTLNLLRCIRMYNYNYESPMRRHTKLAFIRCINSTLIQWCRQLKLKQDRGRVALASYPGSGNTWLRYLIQQATGLYTGSVYIDPSLLHAGLLDQTIDDVIVVKTHYRTSDDDVKYKAAVVLIRDPRDSILSYINYKMAMDHVEAVDDNVLKTIMKNSTAWTDRILEMISSWEMFYTDWLTKFKGSKHIVVYDQLVTDTEHELRRLFAFLGVPVSEADLECALVRKKGIFKRNKHVSFDPFSRVMYEASHRAKDKINRILTRSIGLTKLTKPTPI